MEGKIYESVKSHFVIKYLLRNYVYDWVVCRKKFIMKEYFKDNVVHI